MSEQVLAWKMKQFRAQFSGRATAEYSTDLDVLAGTLTEVGEAGPFGRSFRGVAHLMLKETRRVRTTPANQVRKSAQILVFDSRHERVLVQHRGKCKRHF